MADPTRVKELESLVAAFVWRWEDDIENDEEINGGDAVDWLVEFYQEVKKALAMRDIPAHIDVFPNGVAKCHRCGLKLAAWEDGDELQEWIGEHAHKEDDGAESITVIGECDFLIA